MQFPEHRLDPNHVWATEKYDYDYSILIARESDARNKTSNA